MAKYDFINTCPAQTDNTNVGFSAGMVFSRLEFVAAGGWANIKNIRAGTGSITATDVASIWFGTGEVAVADIAEIPPGLAV